MEHAVVVDDDPAALLSPVLEELLPDSSRILAFQHRFRILSVNRENTGAIAWIFPGQHEPSEQLPEDTSLQKKMKAFLLSGGKG